MAILLALTSSACNFPQADLATREEESSPTPNPVVESQLTPPATQIPEPSPTAGPIADLDSSVSESKVHKFTARLRTSSGWTRVLIEGAQVAGVDHTVLQGGDLPSLQIRRVPELRINHKAESGQVVEVEYEVYMSEIDEGPIRVGIGKGHAGRTDFELIAMAGEQEIPIREMVHVGVADASDPLNRRWFEMDAEELAAAVPNEISHRTFPEQLLAFYYPWYGNPDGPSGTWRAWDAKPPPNNPELGLYDSMNPEVFRQHIRQARQAEVDGFIVSWWGRGRFTDDVFREVILPTAKEEQFPVAIYYEIAESQDQIVRDFRHILMNFGQDPAYLKVDGAPVIFVYGRVTRNLNGEEWQGIFAQLDKAGLECFCQAEGLAAAFHLGDVPFDYLFEHFDGVHLYLPGAIPQEELAGLYSAFSLKAMVKDVSFAATVSPGFDNTPWYEEHGFEHKVIDREGGDYYRRTWRAAVDSGPDWILLTSFNEWHEGSEIEPSEEYGETYLDLTGEWAGAWKNQSAP